MNQSHWDGRQSRGSKYKGKGRQEDPVVFTLDEWEKIKGGMKSVPNANFQDTSHDEELAWQLQNHLDLEECNVRRGPGSEAERIRMNMFNFGRSKEGRNFFVIKIWFSITVWEALHCIFQSLFDCLKGYDRPHPAISFVL
ncbi:hypothetical protein H6P81_003447 [Aristolochia fimbriata]|uniref:Uncharacterized protein n=1 Tax=Aristolochia fimbriata TaxID=158543 RepID=A0AAV7FD38_ARIFI|nr:hypothetical protein H6P81_003447 [Aristolochia fimbriata]